MKTLEITSYDQQALDFLANTGAKIEIEFSHSGKHFEGDTEDRDIYNVVLSRGTRKYKFTFGSSLNDSGFYYQINKTKYPLDRKHISKSNLKFFIKMQNYSFETHLDTIHYPIKPSEYSILACLTKYDPNTFEDFCNEFGYDTDSRSAKKIYKAVVKEWQGVTSLFSDKEIEQLQEVQ